MPKDHSSGVTTRSASNSKKPQQSSSSKSQTHISDSDSLSSKPRKKKSKMNNGLLSKSTEEVVQVNGTAASHLLQQQQQNNNQENNQRRLQQLDQLERERGRITLWRQPFTTLQYFVAETFCLIREWGAQFVDSGFLLPIISAVLLFGTAYIFDGPHQLVISYLEKKVLICLYWIGLGVLSSIGLGTGLHTFILYLGPHIAAVTLAAYECGTLKFPEPPYPDEIICPTGGVISEDFVPSLWNVMSKVRLESFMWGLGTAIGELPPYFMARAARLSGRETEELMELQALSERRSEAMQLTIVQRAKLFMEQLAANLGFFGILLGASIPNPLFDLAGITCGHFLVPFSTFFGATLIGKAVIKMHIQMIFVIITFSERHVEHLVSFFTAIPKIGEYLEHPFKEFLQKQKNNLHRAPGTPAHQNDASWLQFIFEKIIIGMVIYFVLSIINSLAQNYHRRLHNPSVKEK